VIPRLTSVMSAAGLCYDEVTHAMRPDSWVCIRFIDDPYAACALRAKAVSWQHRSGLTAEVATRAIAEEGRAGAARGGVVGRGLAGGREADGQVVERRVPGQLQRLLTCVTARTNHHGQPGKDAGCLLTMARLSRSGAVLERPQEITVRGLYHHRWQG
jgi:hypothetical protein